MPTPRRPQISTTISQHARSQLTELCESLGATQSEVVSLAIDRLYQSEERSKRTMSTLEDEIRYANDVSVHNISVFDGSYTLIEVTDPHRSVSQVAQRLGLLPRNVTATGDVRGTIDGRHVVITRDIGPYLRDRDAERSQP